MNEGRKRVPTVLSGMLAAVLLASPLHPQGRTATFGPLTLGKPLPALPACGPRNSEGALQVREPCLEDEDLPEDKREWTVTVGNLPFDGGYLLVQTSACAQNRMACPIVQIETPVYEYMCAKVLAHLTAKFGAPVHHPVTVQNGFGAHWTQQHYYWKFTSGDLVYYAVHDDIDGGPCHLEATTRAFRAANDKKPEVKF